MNRFAKLTMAFLAAALVAIPSISRANAVEVFSLTSDHCTGGCGTPPFGEIVVTDLGGGTLDFAVTLFNNNEFVNTGFPLTFAFNLNGGPTITYSNLTAGWGIPNAIGSTQNAGSYSQDGAGTFQYGVLWGLQGGGNGTAGPLHFDISAGGLTLLSLAQNAGGQFFAADIFSGTNGNTGNVDASSGTTHETPEPGILSLLGIGLLAVGTTALRRRRS